MASQDYVTGMEATAAECWFCGLKVNDYEEIDYLRLNEESEYDPD